ncbi:GNAT family N-acetyltransferase [bacterium]|nr:GNAT family N-acetyltransferase [bacterium]
MDWKIRPMTVEDGSSVRKLWENSEGINISDADTPAAVKKLVQQIPNFSLVAEDPRGAIIGSVLGSCDTRRGYIHHLVVCREKRGKGLGKTLMMEIERAFRAAGIKKIHLFVVSENEKVCDFYRKIGWTTRQDVILMSKKL